MVTMLSALLLLGIVGACVVMGFVSEETIESLSHAAIEAKRWINIQLDSLGPRLDLDAGSDMEAGMGETDEIRPMDWEHLLPLPAARPSLGGPIRRSVYRGQAGGVAPTLATSLQPVQSDYASLSNCILQSEPRRDMYLPRPIALPTARATSTSILTSATASVSLPRPVQERGTSFDADRSAGVSFRVRHVEREHGSRGLNDQGEFGRANQPPLPDVTNRPLLLHDGRGQGSEGPSSVVAAFGGITSASPSSSSSVRLYQARARARSHRRSSSSNMVNMASAITPMPPAHRRSATRHLPSVLASDNFDAASNADCHRGCIDGSDTVEGRFPYHTDCERKSSQPGSDSYGGPIRAPELRETESLNIEASMTAGVGVRRRLSPRAEGCSPQRGAGVGAGWAPVSPPQQDGLQFDDGEYGDTSEGMDDRLRPRVRFADASPMSFAQVLADASTPKAGAAGLRGNGFGRDPRRDWDNHEGNVGVNETVATPSHIGLKCSSPLYDRETNMLGGLRVPRNGRARSPRPSPSPKVAEKHAREGRDFTSTQASAAGSLDLAFEELELTNLIGGGGFGQVHQGLWRGTPVAVKVLVPGAQRDLDDEIAADFQAEVLMLAALRHPNVCLFMAACMTPPNRAIVTELVTRGSLWQALRNDHLPSVTLGMDAFECSTPGPRGGQGQVQHPRAVFNTPAGCWPWPAIMKVAMGTACGMNYLHRREPFPILHRDLKSANILLDECFNVKICDFGLASWKVDEKSFVTFLLCDPGWMKAHTNSMTGNCGTTQWMAPEILASKKYTETADVYSFAVVCWELLTRDCPYEGLNQIQVAVKVLNDGLRPDIPEWCPHEFRALIEDSWQQKAGERPSFGEILQKLRSLPDPLPSVV